MKKSILALALLAAAGTANASPFYLDIGTNYGPAGDQVNATSTSLKNEYTVLYQSSTTITDTDVNGIDIGDTFTTSAGLAVGGFNAVGLSHNQITGFDPAQVFNSNSDNGYATNYLISFTSTDLVGNIINVAGGVPFLSFTSGIINFLLTFDGVNFINFMDLNVTGGQTDGVGTSLVGTTDFTAVDATFNNLFHSGTTTCLGSTGFKDITTNCAPVEIGFNLHFDTNIFVSDFAAIGNNQFRVTSNHDGSGTFSTVPEPSTLALLGLSMLMMSGVKRLRKS